MSKVVWAALAALSFVGTGHAQAAEPSAEYKRGKLLYLQCRACHETQAGQPHRVGPNLNGFLGKKAASIAGFNYSPALKKAAFTWDRKSLDAWLTKPSAVVPGNTMAYFGLANPADRAALIAFLEVETAPAPAPAKK